MGYYKDRTAEPFQQDLLEDDFNVTEHERAFVEQLVSNGLKKGDAARAARPHLSKRAAGVQASRWLQNSEVRRYLDYRREQAMLRARLTEDEVIAKARLTYAMGTGQVRVQETHFQTSEDGEQIPQDFNAYRPNLSAANQAVELLRKIGGFGVERAEMNLNARGLDQLSDEEKIARLRELATKAGVLTSYSSANAEAPAGE